jgi:hypothetical protein
VVGINQKFTRIPKQQELVPKLREAGIGLHVLPTYLCVLDHADNKTGRAWMSLNRIAGILGVCRRTVERHMKQLCAAGLILRNHQQRGKRGRFSTRRYVVLAVLFFAHSTVRHQGRTTKQASIKKRTKPSRTTPPNPLKSPDEQARRRREGYEWFFGLE